MGPTNPTVSSDDQECPENDRECVAKLSGPVLTNIRIVRNQDYKLTQDGWDNIDGLPILSKGWQKGDRLREGKILQHSVGQSRDGKRKRGSSGWWWLPSQGHQQEQHH